MANKVSGGIVTIGLWLALLGHPAISQDAHSSPDARALIERQLDAFAHDDAPAAYAFAAPGIKQIFPDPSVFMSMVRQQYTPVYHHRSVEFGPSQVSDDEIGQAVTFTDSDGQVWTAHYALEKQSDGQWAIAGCVMQKSADKAL